MSWLAFTVDVEEWFHILDTDAAPPISEWTAQTSLVESNTQRLLDRLENAGVLATFFALGWVAERQPALIREIARRGHEVASHGHEHKLAYQVGPEAFREDAARSKAILEDVLGVEVKGYRAAGFSITENTPWAFEELAGLGFRYDSSVFPGRRGHGGYRGGLSVPHRIRSGAGLALIEFPISPLSLGPLRLPFSGGGYLRLFPSAFVRWCLERMLRDGVPCNVYVHPREVDPNHPRLRLSLKRRFMSYVNVHRGEEKVVAVLRAFPPATFRRLGDAAEALAEDASVPEVKI